MQSTAYSSEAGDEVPLAHPLFTTMALESLLSRPALSQGHLPAAGNVHVVSLLSWLHTPSRVLVL